MLMLILVNCLLSIDTQEPKLHKANPNQDLLHPCICTIGSLQLKPPTSPPQTHRRCRRTAETAKIIPRSPSGSSWAQASSWRYQYRQGGGLGGFRKARG
ncbi:hypothetical protein BDV12DRAFT_166822 [Aspergillus spectabilis]